MRWRIGFFLALVVLSSSAACAQVVRFQTSVGDFDLVLNPTSNPALQGHVDNLLHYVLSGRYDDTVINRAAKEQDGVTPFVLQMGSFETSSVTIPPTVNGFQPIQTFDPIQGAPAQSVGLSNTIGTVGFALRSDGQGGTDHNSGTGSFYVNMNDNSFLDPDFAVFARVADLTTINTIMALPTIDLTQYPGYGFDAGGYAFTELPLLPSGHLVFIRKAFVVQSSTNPKADYNGNGKVDAADYIAWRDSQAKGIIGAGLIGDGNENGVVDQNDYTIWRAHFGATTIAGTALSTVPEPSAFALLMLVVSWCGTHRFQRLRFAAKQMA